MVTGSGDPTGSSNANTTGSSNANTTGSSNANTTGSSDPRKEANEQYVNDVRNNEWKEYKTEKPLRNGVNTDTTH